VSVSAPAPTPAPRREVTADLSFLDRIKEWVGDAFGTLIVQPWFWTAIGAIVVMLLIRSFLMSLGLKLKPVIIVVVTVAATLIVLGLTR